MEPRNVISREKPTLDELFRRYGQQYIREQQLKGQEKGIINLLGSCRTPALGAHIQQCTHCSYSQAGFNSCRNRHCPTCQYKDKERWFEQRKKELLPVSYFHLVFTIPAQLNPMVLQNRKVMYNILFRAASESLLELGKDTRYLGASLGIIAVLHTWGQNLMEHPHLHCLVPAGGLTADRENWIHTCKNYLIPVQVISALFKKKFCIYLRQAYRKEELRFYGKVRPYSTKPVFSNFVGWLYNVAWVVNSQARPFLKPEHALEYLSRYINRIAVSNRRIIKVQGDRVTFLWKNYRTHKTAKMTLEVNEFIRRFLLHVLPEGFFKVRYYGIFASRKKKDNISQARQLLEEEGKLKNQEEYEDRGFVREKKEEKIWVELYNLVFRKAYNICPKCKEGRLIYGGQIKEYQGFG